MKKQLLLVTLLPLAMLTGCNNQEVEPTPEPEPEDEPLSYDVELAVEGEDFELDQEKCKALFNRTYTNGLLQNIHYYATASHHHMNGKDMEPDPYSSSTTEVFVDHNKEHNLIKFSNSNHPGKVYIYDGVKEETYVTTDGISYAVSDVKFANLDDLIETVEWNSKYLFNGAYTISNYQFSDLVVTFDLLHQDVRKESAEIHLEFNEAKDKIHISNFAMIKYYDTYAFRTYVDIASTGDVVIGDILPE